MNTARLIAVQIGIFSALVISYWGPCLAAERWFGLHSPWPRLIGSASLAVTLWVVLRGLLRSQAKKPAAFSTSRHDLFGEVDDFEDHWEASVILTEGWPAVKVWGEGAAPIKLQTSNFSAFRARYPDLLARAQEGTRMAFPSAGFLSLQDLKLDELYLGTGKLGSFDLCFSVPGHERDFPRGITVQFDDFIVVEVSDNH